MELLTLVISVSQKYITLNSKTLMKHNFTLMSIHLTEQTASHPRTAVYSIVMLVWSQSKYNLLLSKCSKYSVGLFTTETIAGEK